MNLDHQAFASEFEEWLAAKKAKKAIQAKPAAPVSSATNSARSQENENLSAPVKSKMIDREELDQTSQGCYMECERDPQECQAKAFHDMVRNDSCYDGYDECVKECLGF